MPSFTWQPFQSELGTALLSWRDRQPELIAFAESLRAKNLPVTPLRDKDAEGNSILLSEIDPFTFLGIINRGIKDSSRKALAGEFKRFFGLKAEVPRDFDGIPILNNQRSWLFSYSGTRGTQDIDKLWDVFEAGMKKAPLEDPAFAAAFEAALEVRGTKVNLTMGLFWFRPAVFLSVDSTMRAFLGLALPSGGLSYSWYKETLQDVVTKHGHDFPELSYDAWAHEPPPEPVQPLAGSLNDWLVGAVWDDQDQTQRFLDESVWENGYQDKYLDEVREMAVGDRIAIKSSSTQKHGLPFDNKGKTISKMTIKAVGTVMAKSKDGRTVEVEWEPAEEHRDWYFYTGRSTVWKLKKDDERAQRLARFVFDGEDQDISFFMAPAPTTGTAGNVDDMTGGGVSKPFGPDDVIEAGAFIEPHEVDTALRRLRAKKNLILQGAPGTGKSFLAPLLAYALMEEEAPERIVTVQFHPSTSYEDFVRGYRPTEVAGAFELVDGPFLRLCQRAHKDRDRAYVMIIDEINRGNLSQIFGELFLLLEGDKRRCERAVTPLYPKKCDARGGLWVPPNVYVIGTMNIADRSLALVDFALRRRFAFLTLPPRFESPKFRGWLTGRGLQHSVVDHLTHRMLALNSTISSDTRLGSAFRVGHSFFCPAGSDFSRLGLEWYREIIETEIVPLLDEYWYDDEEKVTAQMELLLA